MCLTFWWIRLALGFQWHLSIKLCCHCCCSRPWLPVYRNLENVAFSYYELASAPLKNSPTRLDLLPGYSSKLFRMNMLRRDFFLLLTALLLKSQTKNNYINNEPFPLAMYYQIICITDTINKPLGLTILT